MVSLNEKRSKIRYVVQNKTEWVDDGNKFGQRMLEKMGWQTGAGLGKNEDGMTEHIDMKFKANLKGVGFVNGKYDHTWVAHSQSFDSVLQQLQQTHPTSSNNSLNNVAQTIQQTKTRFNYKKQSGGKDLSSRSNHELDCIFGWNKANQINEQEKQDKQEQEEDKQTDLYVTSQQSIQDYFKQKFIKKAQKSSTQQQGEESPLQQQQQEEEETATTKKKKRKHFDSEKEEESMTNPYSNSNLNQLEGYDGWKINSSFDQILKKKEKTKKRKSSI